jgi:hypothetical protein
MQPVIYAAGNFAVDESDTIDAGWNGVEDAGGATPGSSA